MSPVSPVSPGRRWRAGAGRAAALVLAVSLGLTACSGRQELAADAAAGLQTAVGVVRQAAADGRYDDALVGLEQVRHLVDAALAGGEVSADRAAAILVALERSRAEVLAAQAGQAVTVDAQGDGHGDAVGPGGSDADPGTEVAATTGSTPETVEGPGPSDADGEPGSPGRSGSAPGPSGNRGHGND